MEEPYPLGGSQEIEKLFAGGTLKRYSRHETIMNLDHYEGVCYYLKSGYVKVTSYTYRGEERIHYLYKPGDVFPIEVICNGYAGSGISFVALSPQVEVYVIPEEKAKKFFIDHPLEMGFLLGMLVNMLGRIYTLNIDLPILRVIDRLTHMAKAFGSSVDDYILIDITISQQEFASSIHLSRETVSKIFKVLQAQHGALFGRNQIIVFPKKLEELRQKYESTPHFEPSDVIAN